MLRTLKILSLIMLSAILNTVSAQGTKDSLTLEIEVMDSILFTAFNNHDLDKLKTLFSEDLEFYHDQDGLKDYQRNMNDMKSIFDRKNSRIVRTRTEESFEVYPVKNYGAIQTGTHKFCNTENGQTSCGTFKFVHLWKKTQEGWRLSRVMSYGH